MARRKLAAGNRLIRSPGTKGKPVRLFAYNGANPPEYALDPTVKAACGTYAGAQLHMRMGERKCAACLRAQAAYIKAWRRRGKCVRGLGWPATP